MVRMLIHRAGITVTESMRGRSASHHKKSVGASPPRIVAPSNALSLVSSRVLLKASAPRSVSVELSTVRFCSWSVSSSRGERKAGCGSVGHGKTSGSQTADGSCQTSHGRLLPKQAESGSHLLVSSLQLLVKASPPRSVSVELSTIRFCSWIVSSPRGERKAGHGSVGHGKASGSETTDGCCQERAEVAMVQQTVKRPCHETSPLFNVDDNKIKKVQNDACSTSQALHAFSRAVHE
jgi:hypothetical protein